MISKEVKRARVTAIVFGTLSSLTLIACVFAFIQHGLAKRNAQLVEEYLKTAKECETRSSAMQGHAQIVRIELERKNDVLEQELIKLRTNRTK